MGAVSELESLIAAARAGDKRAVGRLVSLVENDPAGAVAALQSVYDSAHDSWITGITGAPGTGKSTLAGLLIERWRAAGKQVAVLAVDPTSPFTGGALLGDRIRMQYAAGDTGVLVRSMATRGWLGGMARATERVGTLCAGLGYDEILIETVGVGQSEVDIATAADTTVVVVTPGWGDGVQVAKAGVMEIGDVFVVNKADREGTADAVRELHEMLQLAAVAEDGWHPPVVPTVATGGDGLDELAGAIGAHRRSVADVAGQSRQAGRRVRDFHRAVLGEMERTVAPLLAGEAGSRLEADVAAGTLDPWRAAAELLAEARNGGAATD